MTKFIKYSCLSLLTLVLINPGIALAGRDAISWGGIAGNIHGGASILVRFMWAACIIVGLALFFSAAAQFQIHRRNPKLVPLTTVAMYLILALITIAIPFVENIFSFEDSYEGSEGRINNTYIDIDK
jgi:hypothetical protein